MRAAVLHAVGDLRVEDRPIPTPGPDEVLIRVEVCGVCGSDATEFGRGKVLAEPPVVLGHEFVGTVEAIGPDVDGLAPGATVVCGAGVSCGRCAPCRAGRTNLCRTYRTLGFHRDGGLAGYVVAPAAIVLDVSDTGLTTDTLGLAQPMAIAVHAVRRSGLRAGQDAVVVGAGGIGAFIAFAAASTGARVLVLDRNDDRLELARRLGAFAAQNARTTELTAAIAAAGLEPEVFFEVSGSPEGLAQVLGAACPSATILPVGIQRGEPALPLGSFTLREYTIVGTVAHVFADDIPEAVRLLATREDWSDVARTVVPLEDVEQAALRPLLDGGPRQIKTLVDPWIDAPRSARHRVAGSAIPSIARSTSTADDGAAAG
ncbi:zinc-dependent alcohol dehydrogenase [Microbacterium invictum]|uniref:Alcohol dehydrogenase catalytic domain-containing protein n=1 Tax=Microbacterium invictum TaxID=515415 RepID=A0ABZ0VF31_9MICO|nr:alcohol dehydrogenase catalytic domain-containing protein [Microbacterium invictum]WQB72006.1 alcohol dehydrogenase catalytic domain-containing protein [Microbacterium invictum]